MHWTEILGGILLLAGCFFSLTGSVGIVRMPDFYTRIHPAGKSDTLAQFLILGGLIVQSQDPLVMAKLALLGGLLLVTSPTATHAVAQAAYHSGPAPMLVDFEPSSPSASPGEKSGQAKAKAPAAASNKSPEELG